jgi:ferrous iron transport protein B
MAISYQSELKRIKDKSDVVFALAGNPNVGKSSIFNQLTGLGVVTANYPGKTVEVNVATTTMGDLNLGIVDLPGTYAIGAVSDDQWVARKAVLDGKPDAVIMVLDATNLARNLYMLLQFLDLGFPVVVALNIVDIAEHKGIHTNAEKLANLLGVPVVETVATNGKGLDVVLQTALKIARQHKDGCSYPTYGHDVAEVIDELAKFIAAVPEPLPYGLTPRAVAMLLLENDDEFVTAVQALPSGSAILERSAELAGGIELSHGESAAMRIARERHGLAGTIAEQLRVLIPNVRVR